MPTNQLRFSVFDQDLCVQTDSMEYLDLLRTTYNHFLVDRPKPNGNTTLNVSFYLGSDIEPGKPRFLINGEQMQVEDHQLLHTEYIHGLILSTLYTKVSSHYLFHAAGLSINGKGVILTADSGYGKTTLALALVQRGFRFLSDEIAALGYRDGLIYPFPRGLHIREETLHLLDLPIHIEKASRWFGKYLIDIEDLFPGMIGEPVKCSYLFILKNGTGSQPGSLPIREFKALVSHTTSAFLQQIRTHPAISEVQVNHEQGYPCLTMKTDQRMKVIPYFEDLCIQDGIMILDLIKREDDIADFTSPVDYQRVSKSQAAFELLRRFLGGHRTELLASRQDFSGLLFELTCLLENTHCYQITVGPLKETVNLISDIICNDQ